MFQKTIKNAFFFLFQNPLKYFVYFIAISSLKFSLLCFFLLDCSKGESLFKLTPVFIMEFMFLIFVFRVKNGVLFSVLYLFQLVYLFLNVTYYSYFGTYFHFSQALVLYKEALEVAGKFAIPFTYKNFLLLLDLPFAVVLILRYRLVHNALKKSSVISIKSAGLAVTVLLGCMLGLNYQYPFKDLVGSQFGGETVIFKKYGFIVNNAVDLYLTRNEDFLIKQLQYGPLIKNESTPARPQNVICLQIETLDANIIGKKYRGKYVAPFLSKLRKESIYFPFCLSLHSGGGTTDAEFSILNSVIPFPNYPVFKLRKYDYPNSLIKRFKKENYEVYGFHNNNADFYNRDVAFYKMAFDNFYDFKKMNLIQQGWGACDGNVFNFVKAKLAEQNQPFFYYIITLSSHEPFKFVRPHYNNPEYDNIDVPLIRDYYNSISYVDHALEDFVSFIRENVPNYVLLIWGDHSYPLYKGKLHEFAYFEQTGGNLEFVPFYVLTNNLPARIYDDRIVTFLDFAPLILGLAQIPYEIKTSGVNPLQNKQGTIIWSDGKSYDRQELLNRAKKAWKTP
jgi:phosphoglycerol transferase MdoB-like AlkP superfamily enzyme